jgi:hypothetical protein
MYLYGLESDQSYTWSDETKERATSHLAQTPHSSSAPIAPAQSHPAWFPDRALQTMRQARMQVRRRPWPWPQVLSIGELPGLAATNGLRTARGSRANGGVPCQLSPSPRDLRGDLRDQPRTAAPSRGTLKHHCERITRCPPRPARCGIGRRGARQYACRLARWQPEEFVCWGGRR